MEAKLHHDVMDLVPNKVSDATLDVDGHKAVRLVYVVDERCRTLLVDGRAFLEEIQTRGQHLTSILQYELHRPDGDGRMSRAPISGSERLGNLNFVNSNPSRVKPMI